MSDNRPFQRKTECKTNGCARKCYGEKCPLHNGLIPNE